MSPLRQEKALEIVRALSDKYSRRILLSSISRPRQIQEISDEEDIPLSTCYRRVKDMLNFGFLKVQRISLSQDGRRVAWYTTTFESVSMHLESGKLFVDIESPSMNPAEKFYDKWINLKHLDYARVSCLPDGQPEHLHEEKVELWE